MTSTTQWFRAATQVGKTYPPSKGRLSAGAAFSFAHFRHRCTLICLTALRHRLQAEGRGSDPPHLSCSGQVRSRDIRADSSTLHRPQMPPSVFIGRAFCAVVSGSDRIMPCLSMRSVWPPKLLCIILSSPSRHEREAAHRVRCRHFQSPRFVRRQYIAGFQSDFRRYGHRRR